MIAAIHVVKLQLSLLLVTMAEGLVPDSGATHHLEKARIDITWMLEGEDA